MSLILGNQNENTPPKVKLDIAALPNVACSRDGCDSIFFQPVTYFKKISALQSPTGKETFAPIETYACVTCGNINKEFMVV